MSISDSVKAPQVRPEAIRRVAAARAAGTVRVPLKRVMAEAGAHFNAGRLDKAEDVVRRILIAKADTADAHNVLGAILHRRGKLDAAAASFAEAARLSNSSAHYANLGEVHRVRGDLKAAAKALGKAVRLDEKSPQAHNNLGIVHFEEKEYDKAIQHYRKAIAVNASYAEAYNNLGNALRAQGRGDEAMEAFERAIEIREDYAEAYNNLASVLRDRGKTEEAEVAYERALTLRPNYDDAADNMASLLVQEERYEDALGYLGETLKRNPRRATTLVLVGRAQIARRSWQQAEQALRAALMLKPDNTEAMVLLGQVEHELDRVDAAIALFRKALALKPDLIDAHNMLAVSLKAAGKLDEARETLHAALKLNPSAIGILSNLADLEKFTPEHPLFVTMTDLLKRAQDAGNGERVTSLHFAIGKAYDDMGEHVKAFDHYAEGAKNKRATLNYDEERSIKFMNDVRETFDAAFFANRPFAGNPTDKLIFIVGMPRSGSTLTEQILASHPDVFGAGEIKTLSQSITRLRQKLPHLPRYPALATAMKPAQYEALAQLYFKAVNDKAPEARRITDKLLSNYLHLGLINTLFPNAKIVHTMRNPIDTCLSAFTKLFKDEMAHSYDLNDLGRYYRRYETLMEHWRTHLPPGTMIDVQYEDMVANTETRARELIAFCGLEWDDRCLAFHETVRPVKTASVSQVRKPLYTTSVERWRRYGDRLQPLIDALGMDARGAPRNAG